MKRVVVVDYGVGNIHSVVNAFRAIGAEATLADDPKVVAKAERLVLPGVGAFPDGMRGLAARGLDDALRELARSGRPLLGICLGMQLFFTESEEFGTHSGLGLIPGRVLAIPRETGIKVPHIGWNRVLATGAAAWDQSFLREFPVETSAYFVHSFTAHPSNPSDRLAIARYGSSDVTAAVQALNVTGCQFHPEKSGPMGLRVLETFVRS